MIRTHPRISVIIPAFNRERLILETLKSIADQTFSDFECLVVDDGSSDRTKELVKDFALKDERFSLLCRPNTYAKGAPTCRNIGLSVAKGEFIQFFDSDDLMLPNMLEDKLKFILSSDNLDFVVSKVADMYAEGDISYPEYSIESKNAFHEMVESKLRFLTPGPLFNKKFLDGFDKGFDERLPRHQEWEFYCRLLSVNPNFRVMDKFHCLRRHHSQSIKAQSDKAGNLKYRRSKILAMTCLNENTNGQFACTLYTVFRPYVLTTLKTALYQMNIFMALRSTLWLIKFKLIVASED